MFAVIRTGGKQYKVAEKNVLRIEKLAGEPGDSITFDDILAAGDGTSTLFGDNAGKVRVSAEVLEQGKDDKVIVFKKKRRHNYRRKNGHRQQITTVRVTKIALDGKL